MAPRRLGAFGIVGSRWGSPSPENHDLALEQGLHTLWRSARGRETARNATEVDRLRGATASALLIVCLTGLMTSQAARAQVPVVVRSARALEGAGKLSTALRAGRLTRASRLALLREPEVVELLKNLDDPAVALYLRENKEVETLARGLRRELRLAMRTSPIIETSSACAGGRCALRQIDDVLKEIDVAAVRATRATELTKVEINALTKLAPVTETQTELATATRQIMKRCAGDARCIERSVKELENSGWFKRLFSKTCIGRNPTALSNLIRNYMVGFTAFGATWLASDSEFPFDMFATITVMGAVYGEVACVNTFEPKSPGAADMRYFSAQRLKESYLRYLKVEPIFVGTFVTASMTEDYFRGRDVFTKDAMLDYLKEGAYIAVFDFAFNNVRAVLVLDPLYLKGLPRLDRFVTEGFHRGVFGRVVNLEGKGFLFKQMYNLPGTIIDWPLRSAIKSADGYVFFKAKDFLAGDIFGEEVAPPPVTPSGESTPATIPPPAFAVPGRSPVQPDEKESAAGVITEKVEGDSD